MNLIPPTAVELIEQLDAAYPHQCIGKKQSIEDAHRYAGKRDLIEHLKLMLVRTEEEALVGELLDN